MSNAERIRPKRAFLAENEKNEQRKKDREVKAKKRRVENILNNEIGFVSFFSLNNENNNVNIDKKNLHLIIVLIMEKLNKRIFLKITLELVCIKKI